MAHFQRVSTSVGTDTDKTNSQSLWAALLAGAAVGVLGGMVGLGGAEFRLPLLIGMFAFAALQAVVINKATSLVVVGSALVFRSTSVPVDALAEHWSIAANLLCGSLVGAWFGASWATRIKSRTLYRTLAVLLVFIAIVLLVGHEDSNSGPLLQGTSQWVAGVAAGFGIGIVAAIMGVAGGELLIPTLVILFGLDVKLAGSMSLAVSLPTMLVAFFRYSRHQAFDVLRTNKRFVVALAVGSIIGAGIGGSLLGIVPSTVMLPVLSLILVVSSVKVWRH